ncbi:MAG: DUF2341 domain-containing protein [Pseudomonadota bacterium]|nr:DUF2341 domain-containing protein [Pseudomonadota bacterium]
MRSALLIMFLSMLPGLASAWWNEDWSYRVGYTVDTSALADVDAETVSVPVLIRLHSGNFEDFFLVKEDLSDLRFIGSDDKTPLKFHVESFDLLNQLAFIWVNLPVQIAQAMGPKKIWMYYGNSESMGGQDAAGTYGADTMAVFHFDAANPAPVDQTAYQTPVAEFTAEFTESSLIAGGARFAGSGVMVIPQSQALTLDPATGYTLSFWIKPTAAAQDTVVLNQGDGNSALAVSLAQGIPTLTWGTGGEQTEVRATNALAPDQWHNLALVVAADSIALLVNGESVVQESIAGFPAFAGDLTLGGDPAAEQYLSADLDELIIERTARSQGELRFRSQSQGMMSTIVTAGQGEQLGNAGGESYFVTIFQSTGTEGWTVIVLLTIMAVISWGVMVFKAFFINRVKKDNNAFMAEYRKLDAMHIAALDRDDDDSADVASESQAASLFGKHDHFQSSPLYHIYHRGISETKHRLSDKRKSGGVLSDASFNSIRSALEAYVVREIQSLNSNMVLLTIAVSGGPFLGLLGTVLGVMITFAAIASTGDVNVAAIAPGVAAALLTTVAGLVVAIPALFGYNWLATRIKEMVADMHMFTDELVTKLAEHYCE